MAEKKHFVITIVGAESSGKTSLAMLLAEYFNCPWVPEYAREYLQALGRTYNEKDLEIIAVRQLEIIKAVVSGLSASSLKGELKIYATAGSNKDSPLNDLKSAIGNRQSAIIIVDGGMMTLRMWARIKYKMEIPIVEEALKNDITDLYLLCRPRKEWTPDPMREAPLLLDRAWIYNQYVSELSTSPKDVEIISSQDFIDFIKKEIVE